MKKRSIPVCIVLSIVTFGIYAIYWFIQLNNDINQLAQPEKATSGGMAFLLSMVTCGIYTMFWSYKEGGLLDAALAKKGMPAEGRGTLYLILTILGLGIVAWAMMQNTINTMLPDNA